MAYKRTKIVATVGPASGSRAVLRQMVEAGADVFRLNFSHGSPDHHVETAQRVTEIAAETGANLALLADLPGPKVRIGRFEDGAVELEAGRPFTLTLGDHPSEAGTRERVSISHDGLSSDIEVGQVLLLDDGNQRLRVTALSASELETVVEVGGHLASAKGVSVPGAKLSIEPLTERDLQALEISDTLGVDWLAQSFVRSGDDLARLRRHLERLGSKAKLMAKIETPEAVERFDEILETADGIMVARGDLGVEMRPEEIPVVQKQLIARAHEAGKPVVTATQMLESMVHHPRPTRAETSDVANAIFDGTDAVMLSAETAIGDFPVESVEMMRKVAMVVEASEAFEERRLMLRPDATDRTPDAIARAACEVAETLSAQAILVFTSSGTSAWRIARNRPKIPVLALTPNEAVRRSLALAFGIQTELAPVVADADEMVAMAIERAGAHDMAAPGERIVITAGVPFGVEGTTNLVWVERVDRT